MLFSLQLFQPFVSCHRPAVSTVLISCSSSLVPESSFFTQARGEAISSLESSFAGSIWTIRKTGKNSVEHVWQIGMPIIGLPIGSSKIVRLPTAGLGKRRLGTKLIFLASFSFKLLYFVCFCVVA